MSEQYEKFHYSYSAAQKEEIESISKKYLPETFEKEADKMEQLRRLDTSVTRKATAVSLAVGVIGSLIMGFGMSLIMTDFGEILHVSMPFISGIVIGVIGMALIIGEYPIYDWILKKQRAKIAPQILKLTEEL